MTTNNPFLNPADGARQAPPGVGKVVRARELVAGEGRDEFTAAALADNSWLTYGVSVRSLIRRAQAMGVEPLPASTELLRAWLIALAREGKRLSTCRTYLSGAAAWHRDQGHVLLREPLRNLLQGIARKAMPAEKAAPLMAAQLKEILDRLDPGNPRDVRDGALLSVMLSASLRGAEAVGLDYERLARGREGEANCGHLKFVDEGIDATLVRSKTSPTVPVPVPVPAAQMPRTVEWMRRWAAVAKLDPGTPVFRPVSKTGRIGVTRLASASITPIVRRRVREHLVRSGMDEAKAAVAVLDYSSHSARAGFLSSGADAGTEEWKLRARSRHKTANVAAGYVRLRAGWNTDWGIQL